MRFNTKNEGRATHYIMVGASKFGFMADKEAQRCKANYASYTNRMLGLNDLMWRKFKELNSRAVMEYGVYLDRYEVDGKDI